MEFNDKQIEILNVAERLFAEEGFDGTSVRDIAKKANINVAMISYYFGSKEKLLEAVVIHRIGTMKLRLENLLQEDSTPIEKIEKLVVYYINQINANRSIYQILHFELSTKKREINTDAFTEVKKNNLKVMESIVKEGQLQGIFQPNINIALLSPTIIGSLIYFHMNKPLYVDLFDLKTDEAYENYIETTLTQHIQKTIKALLLYEN
ncbi:TetR/AcrR family transcriptional regulator [Flavobacterium sp.]|uniref:TetR/AcrR family transcriptional regulator n=1 Tax=Flavobacterium sp. TaxID=239 RepID=UPI000EBB84A7|nr:TetR family transcriptional regulator [Flavobacterium sp.]HCQ13845.1 TetR family transcriptional regulator [Flavobacterium sp.]